MAKTLSEKGKEFVAVDINKDIVDKTAVFIDDAVCLDATDETSLEKLSPREKDIIICAIGSKEPSILANALLRQMGCSNIISRATDKTHERILKAVGAKMVINPNEEYGKKFAYRILFQNEIADGNDDDIQLLDINVQTFMVGKSLIELALPNKYGIIVAAIKKGNKLTKPLPTGILEKDDVLLLVCTEASIEKILKVNS